MKFLLSLLDVLTLPLIDQDVSAISELEMHLIDVKVKVLHPLLFSEC